MAKLPPKKEEGNSQEWLNTYADMVTLLLTFFVLLFASSNLDETKLQYIFQAFQTRGKYINTVVTTPPSEMSDDDGGMTDEPNVGGGEGEMPQSYDELYQFLAEYIDSNNLSDLVSIENGAAYFTLRFNSTVFFDGDSYWLKPDGRKVLDDISPMLRAMDKHIRTLTVTGHTSTGTSSVSDWSLSAERAASVLNYWDTSIENSLYPGRKQVLPSEKYRAEGFGNTMPLYPNDTLEHRQQNRRVEMRLLKEDLDTTDPKVLQDILNHDYKLITTPIDINEKPDNNYENLPEGSADKIVGYITDKFGGNTAHGSTMGPGAVDGSQFIASTESGGDAGGDAGNNGGEQSE